MVDGDTDKVTPVPSMVPPQEPEYQVQLAPVPSAPPVTLKVVELPSQIGSTLAEALVATVELLLTITVTLTHVVILQVPSART